MCPVSCLSLTYFLTKTLQCIITFTLSNQGHNKNIKPLSVNHHQHKLQSQIIISFHHVQRTLSKVKVIIFPAQMSPVTSCLLIPHIFLSTLLLEILNPICSSLMLLQPLKWASGNKVFFILHAFTGNRKSMFLT